MTSASLTAPLPRWSDVDRRTLTLQLGLWMFLATVTMLFAAFTSAYLVRRAGTDWRPLALPSSLWANTTLLAVSSLALECGRRALRFDRWIAARRGVVTAALLGVGFLAGQGAAWSALVAQGVYLPVSPHAAFFYMLTATHALHLVAGLGLLGVVAWRLGAVTRGAAPATAVRTCGLAATCWHFFGGLWAYVFALLALV